MRGYFAFIFLFVFILSADLFAFDEVRAHRTSSNSLAMSDAVVGVADGVEAFYFNPAGLSRKAEQRYFTIGQRSIDKFSHWGIEAGFIDGKTEDPLQWGFLVNVAQTPQIKFQDYILASSYSLNHIVMIGFQQKLSDYRPAILTPRRWAYGLNAGVLVFLTDQIAFGFDVDNFFRSYKNSNLQPVRFTSGVSANFEYWRADVDAERDQSQNKTFFRTGAEAKLPNVLRLRGGYFSDTDGNDRAYSLGLGAELDSSGHSLISIGFRDQLKSSIMVYTSDLSLKF